MMNKALNWLGRMVCVGVIIVGAASSYIGYYSIGTGLLTLFPQYPRLKPYLEQFHLHHEQLIAGGLIAIVLGFLSGFILMQLQGKPSSRGTAKWAGFWEVLRAGLSPRRRPRFLLGRRGRQTVALSQKLQCEHALIMAPNGQFKTSGFMIPNLFEERGLRGLVIHDIKGELLKICGGALSKYLQVVVFAPMDLSLSIHYNPLRHVSTDVDAEDLAACWIDNTGLAPQQYWNDTARLLVQAVILHLVDCEPAAPFSRLGDLLGAATFDQIRQLLSKSKSTRAREIGASFVANVSTDPKLAGQIMSGMATRFLMMRNPQVKALTANHPDVEKNLDLHKLASDPQALFLVIPSVDAKRLKPLTAALLMQLMNHLTRNPQERGVAFYLDELCNAGHIPHYTEHISLVRGQNLALLQVIQDFGQLRREYGADGAQTILTNSNTKVFLPGCGKSESEYASELVGDMTLKEVSYSHQHGSSNGRQHVSYIPRRMMKPDEIRRMKRGTVLIISSNVSPILAKFSPYFKRRRYTRLAELPIIDYTAAALPTPPSPSSGPQSASPSAPPLSPSPAPVVPPPPLPPAPHIP